MTAAYLIPSAAATGEFSFQTPKSVMGLDQQVRRIIIVMLLCCFLKNAFYYNFICFSWQVYFNKRFLCLSFL